MYDSHIHIGSRLLKEEQERHNYWLLTDCFLDGEKSLKKHVENLTKMLKKINDSLCHKFVFSWKHQTTNF